MRPHQKETKREICPAVSRHLPEKQIEASRCPRAVHLICDETWCRAHCFQEVVNVMSHSYHQNQKLCLSPTLPDSEGPILLDRVSSKIKLDILETLTVEVFLLNSKKKKLQKNTTQTEYDPNQRKENKTFMIVIEDASRQRISSNRPGHSRQSRHKP